MPSSKPEKHATKSRHVSAGRIAAVGIGVAALVAPIAAVAGVHARSASSDAQSAVLGSGVMGKVKGGFKPGNTAKRGDLALALHRSMPRMAFAGSGSVASLAANTASVDLGTLDFRVDGVKKKRQGVLVDFRTQLDHDNALASSCNASFTLARGAIGDPLTPLGSWSQELYSGSSGEEDNIAMSFFVTQKTNTKQTYHLLGSNSCTQSLFTDLEAWSIQSFPLDGLGKTPAASRPAPRPSLAKHDR